MPDAGPTSERLEALRERWEAEPGSRVFLQLADEYRRLGRTEEAARVLEEGLESSPNHLAAQVALGRCRLDLGRPDQAVTLLERVVESDPTQMVAYRLLVDAYLREGRAAEARQRLRIYSLLNDSDPEIAELRRRIGELDRSRPEAPADEPPPLEPAPGAEPPPGTGPEPQASEEAPGGPPEEGSREEPVAAASATSSSDGEPFPDLAEAPARRRYVGAPAAGELFALEEPEETAAPAAPGGEVFDLEGPAGASAPDLSSLLEPAGAPPPSPPGAAPGERDRPTLTLGRLYLRQGHLREAEEIFREVLAREPDNAEARRSLEALERSGTPAGEPAAPVAPALGAGELLEGYEGPEGLTDRKRYVLERYLERLRGRAPGDVH